MGGGLAVGNPPRQNVVVIQIINKRNPISVNYTIDGHLLNVDNSSKYLGITFSKDIRLDKHIKYIRSKTNKTPGFIWWNIRGCWASARSAAYQGLVRPILHMPAQHEIPWNSIKNIRLRNCKEEQHHWPPRTTTITTKAALPRWFKTITRNHCRPGARIINGSQV